MKPFLLVLVLAACDRWSGASSTAIWKLPVPDFAAALYATTTPTGDTIAAVADARLGDQDFPGPQIVRIDPDGAIVQTAAVTDIGINPPLAIATDDRGRPVAVWGSNGINWIVAFDEALVPRWKLSANGNPDYASQDPLAAGGLFEVGPQGQVAFIQLDANRNRAVHYVGDDGIERWTAPTYRTDLNVDVRHLRIAPNGDLLLYPNGRLAASNGSRLSNIDADAWASTRDGVSVSLENYGEQVVVREPSGTIRWQRTIKGVGFCPLGGCILGPSARSAVVAMTPSEGVLVQLYQTQEQLLDRSSGDREGSTDHCGSPAILEVDDTGYLALGPICGSSQGLARFRLPD